MTGTRSGAVPAFTTSAMLWLRTLLGWFREDADIDAQLPLLSTFLGHVDPSDTYWYLEGGPSC